MPADSGKKLNALYILQILRKYTDFDHRMTQQQIADKLMEEYGVPISRATVKRTLTELIDEGFFIEYTEVPRNYTDKGSGDVEDSTILTDFYYIHDFTESELHMLIDGLLFSRSVPYGARKELIDKLCELNSSHFSQRMKRVHSMSADSPENRGLFVNIDKLDQAIMEKKQVEITYGYYGTDMKLHARLNEDGTEKKQVLNPYQLVASDGRYYLICNKDNYDDVANYRVDRIIDIRMLETPCKSWDRVRGLENGLKLEEFLFQHVNMFAGKPEKVEFIIPKSFVSVVIDFFGSYVSFFDKGDGTISCHIDVSLEAMRHWAGQFADTVRVVSPESLVEEIREDIRKAAENYGM